MSSGPSCGPLLFTSVGKKNSQKHALAVQDSVGIRVYYDR